MSLLLLLWSTYPSKGPWLLSKKSFEGIGAEGTHQVGRQTFQVVHLHKKDQGRSLNWEMIALHGVIIVV